MGDFFAPSTNGLDVRLQVTPKASRAALGPVRVDESGQAALKVAVTVAPEGGKANAAVIGLLAKSWRLPKSSMSVKSGATGRRKVVSIEGDPREIARRITEWVGNKHE